MHDLTKRFISYLFVVPVVILFLIFSNVSFFSYVIAFFISCLACVSIWEYEKFAKAKGIKMQLPSLIALTFILCYSFFLAAKNTNFHSLPYFLFFLSFFLLCVLHFKETQGAIIDIAVSSFSLVYIALPIGMLLGILFFSLGQDGRWWIAFLVSVTKASDMGAYFAGNLWGKRKLAPTISPGKTVEGVFFGLLSSVVVSLIFCWISQDIYRFSLSIQEGLGFGVLLGLIGPIGDLTESLFKRDAEKKDSNTIPGFGGALDLVDSLLFTAPILYLYLNFIKI